MKSLIFTTGIESLLSKTLSSLWGKGEYKGDLLVLQYEPFSDAFRDVLLAHNTTIVKVFKNYDYMCVDRVLHYQAYISKHWEDYDVLMHMDGNDIEICSPIEQLLEMSTENICCVKEQYHEVLNVKNSRWIGYMGFPDYNEVWSAMKNQYMVNAGMYVGRSLFVAEFLDMAVKYFPYRSDWGVDQVLFNAFVYYYRAKSAKFLGFEWNYIVCPIERTELFYYEKLIDNFGLEIKIAHRVGNTNINGIKKTWDDTGQKAVRGTFLFPHPDRVP
jgi:hypothetical protein